VGHLGEYFGSSLSFSRTDGTKQTLNKHSRQRFGELHNLEDCRASALQQRRFNPSRMSGELAPWKCKSSVTVFRKPMIKTNRHLSPALNDDQHQLKYISRRQGNSPSTGVSMQGLCISSLQ
jgi:hypothetical protein